MSGSSVYVFSTLTAPTAYTRWTKGANDLPVKQGSVIINGGANVADKNLLTPYGTITKISKEDYEMIKDTRLFKMHVENGHVTVRNSSANPDKVADDMTPADRSAQLTENDFGANGPQPVVAEKPPETKKQKKSGKK